MAKVAHLKLVQPEDDESTDERTEAPGLDDFDAFFKHWSPYVAGIGHNILGDPALVDDLVQEVFIKVLENRNKIRDPNAIKSWLTTTAVRRCYRRLRKRKVFVFLGISTPPAYEEAVSNGAPQEHRAMLERVLKSLDDVSAEDRIAWSLRYLQGEKLNDVAQACDCSLATAKRRIARAQEHLEREFGNEP
jgi:RNA polymerase sigma-70 factor (ECF subfamily)